MEELSFEDEKKKKARMILLVYGIVFVILIVFIRTADLGGSNTNDVTNATSNNTNEVSNNVENNNNVNKESDFKLIDEENYEFVIKTNFDGVEYVSSGKRYKNKVAFDYSVNGSTYKYEGKNGTYKVFNPESNSFVYAQPPYVFLNYYDNYYIKNAIAQSKYVDGVYQISSKNLSVVANHKALSDESLNYFTLTKKNDYVTGVTMDITKAVSSSLGKVATAKISIEYSNFGLVEDFEIK